MENLSPIAKQVLQELKESSDGILRVQEKTANYNGFIQFGKTKEIYNLLHRDAIIELESLELIEKKSETIWELVR